MSGSDERLISSALELRYNSGANGGSVMRRLILAFIAFFWSLALPMAAQDAGPTHAPDFRAQQKLAPLYFPPKANAPFMAIAKTLWVQTLPDGSTVTTQNERVVARDMDGRIFQERRTFIPVPDDGKQQSTAYSNEYTDPLHAHHPTAAIRTAKICDLYELLRSRTRTEPLCPRACNRTESPC